MTDFKAAKDLYIPLDNVDYYVGYASKTVINDVKLKKQEGQVMDLSGGKKVNTVLYLKTGRIILLNTTVDTICARRQEEKEC